MRLGHSPDFEFPSVAILPWLCRKRRKAIFTDPPSNITVSNITVYPAVNHHLQLALASLMRIRMPDFSVFFFKFVEKNISWSFLFSTHFLTMSFFYNFVCCTFLLHWQILYIDIKYIFVQLTILQLSLVKSLNHTNAIHNFKWVKITHSCLIFETKHFQFSLIEHQFVSQRRHW